MSTGVSIYIYSFMYSFIKPAPPLGNADDALVDWAETDDTVGGSFLYPPTPHTPTSIFPAISISPHIHTPPSVYKVESDAR